MYITIKWGLIALVALTTSFTAYYSLLDPGKPHGSSLYLAIGLMLFAGSVFVSVIIDTKHKGGQGLKGALQTGLKTALFAVVLFSVYDYVYLKAINPSVLENLYAFHTSSIVSAGLEESEEAKQLKEMARSLSPFAKMTQDLLRLITVATMSALMGAVLARKFFI
ncbi:MAG: DUF4199 domain-containing protein [Bacteroidetes bacterium]|jgi:hypothetical protein|nr:DUF4199 domain-containing protein [Bacteroidota bacterium]